MTGHLLTGLWLISALLCAYICQQIAKRRGLTHPQYVALGLMFGPIGVLITLIAGFRHRRAQKNS
jgi:hypothetical protein